MYHEYHIITTIILIIIDRHDEDDLSLCMGIKFNYCGCVNSKLGVLVIKSHIINSHFFECDIACSSNLHSLNLSMKC